MAHRLYQNRMTFITLPVLIHSVQTDWSIRPMPGHRSPVAPSPMWCVLDCALARLSVRPSAAQVDWGISLMDTVEIRVHPSNLQRVIDDAHERGAKVTRAS